MDKVRLDKVRLDKVRFDKVRIERCFSNGYIDGLVNGVSLVFTMLRTYTSSKTGLSARKSESNSGDATISLRMVNKDTSRTCITLGETFYTIGDGAVCLAHSDGTKCLYDEIAVA